MMASIAFRLFASFGMSLFGLGGAAVYWLVGDKSKALPHAVMWCGMAWAVAPSGEESEAYYAWLAERVKSHDANVLTR